MAKNYDAIVIGTGQAGPPLAERLGQAGWKVAIIERQLFGVTAETQDAYLLRLLLPVERVQIWSAGHQDMELK